jgi:hypothetical protein
MEIQEENKFGSGEILFSATVLILLAAISISGPLIQFHSLEWSLTSTPLGLIYNAFTDWGTVQYLIEQKYTSSRTSAQLGLSLILSLSSLIFIMSKSGKIPEVDVR